MEQKAVLKLFEDHAKHTTEDYLIKIDMKLLCDCLKRDLDFHVEWIEQKSGTLFVPHERLRRQGYRYVYDTLTTTKHPDGRRMCMLISKKLEVKT